MRVPAVSRVLTMALILAKPCTHDSTSEVVLSYSQKCTLKVPSTRRLVIR
jgi:hypothetical protein